jgi:hypothetical protein
MFTFIVSVGTFVLGYFAGVYRQNIWNVKTRIEDVIKDEFKK